MKYRLGMAFVMPSEKRECCIESPGVRQKSDQSEKYNQRSGLRSRSRSNICCGGRLSMGRYGLAAWTRWGSGEGDGATEGVNTREPAE